MSVIEIRFRNGEAYMHKHHCMTLADYENQIKNIVYQDVYENYKKIKDETGVEAERFPHVNYVFFSEIFNNRKVPSTNDILNLYFEVYGEYFEFHDNGRYLSYKNKVYFYNAVCARILRTYPSLIRDFHFFLMLVEDGSFESVLFSCQYDIEGKDIIIKHNGKEYVISLFVDTARSWFYKKIKNLRRHVYGYNEIQIPLVLNRARKCGDFYVYDEDDLIIVKQRILK